MQEKMTPAPMVFEFDNLCYVQIVAQTLKHLVVGNGLGRPEA